MTRQEKMDYYNERGKKVQHILEGMQGEKE